MIRTFTAAALLTLMLAACTPSPPAPQDLLAPTVTVAQPSSAASGATFTLTVTAQDNVAVTRIDVLDGANQVIGSATTSPYTITLTAPANTGTTPVELRYTVRVQDAAGNVATQNVAVLVRPETVPGPADTTPPTVTGSATPNPVASGAALRLQAAAQDNVGVTRVDFYSPQGQLLGTDLAAPFELATTAPVNTTGAATTATYSVRAQDAAGNAATSSFAVQVTPAPAAPGDSTPPTVNASLVLDGGGTVGSPLARVTFHVTATDNVGVVRAEFFDASGTSLGSTIPGQTGPYAVDTRLPANPSAAAITATFTVKVYDAAGNETVGTASVPVAGLFLPAAGAAVGTGNGSVEGTVRVSPTAEEADVMRLVNEVRTKGTLNGANVIPGSCVDGTFQPGVLRPLTYSGTLAHASIKHAEYSSMEGVGGHDETITTSPYFYGVTPQDRADRSRTLFGGPERTAAENAAGGFKDAESVMRAWMASAGHCRNLMYPNHASIGVGHRVNLAWEGVGYGAWVLNLGI